MTSKKIIFISTFILLGLLTLQVKVSHLAGSKAVFTLFDSFAPLAGAFLGNWVGAVAVFAMQSLNFVMKGTTSIDAGLLIRLVAPIFSVLYFGRKTKLNFIVPILAIIIFNLNPVGRSVWFYSLFWLIPILCFRFQNKSLLARSLGATFTAHAVGGALWIWFFNLPRETWLALIPVVIIERALFGFGLAVNYVLIKKLVSALARTVNLEHEIHQD